MTSLLSLKPPPTFKAAVPIPRPGEADESIVLVFKFRSRTELRSFIEAARSMSDTDTVLAMAERWELADPFTRESIDLLMENFVGAGRAIFDTYIREHTKTSAKAA